MNKILGTFVGVSTIAGILGACGMFGGGKTIKNSAQLQSTLLVNNNYQFQAVTPCLASATTCTPDGFGGRVYAASAMLEQAGSTPGQGEGGYAMTFLAATEAVINRPDEGKTGSLTFDLTAPAVFSGLISIPDEGDMPSSPSIPSIEIAFDYIDAKFTLSGHSNTAFNTEWTIRVIMVKDDTIDGLAVQGGDLLIKQGATGTFQWCDASGCSTTRPTTPHRLASAVGALADAGTMQGNPNYAYYKVALATALSPSFAEISDTTRLWTIDFDIESAVNWTVAPTNFATVEDFLENFKLPYACASASCDSTGGIEATMTISAANAVPAAN